MVAIERLKKIYTFIHIYSIFNKKKKEKKDIFSIETYDEYTNLIYFQKKMKIIS